MPLPKDFVDPEPLTARRQWGRCWINEIGERQILALTQQGETQERAEIVVLGKGAVMQALERKPADLMEMDALCVHVADYLPDGIAVEVETDGISLNGALSWSVPPQKSWRDLQILTAEACKGLAERR